MTNLITRILKRRKEKKQEERFNLVDAILAEEKRNRESVLMQAIEESQTNNDKVQAVYNAVRSGLLTGERDLQIAIAYFDHMHLIDDGVDIFNGKDIVNLSAEEIREASIKAMTRYKHLYDPIGRTHGKGCLLYFAGKSELAKSYFRDCGCGEDYEDILEREKADRATEHYWDLARLSTWGLEKRLTELKSIPAKSNKK